MSSLKTFEWSIITYRINPKLISKCLLKKVLKVSNFSIHHFPTDTFCLFSMKTLAFSYVSHTRIYVCQMYIPVLNTLPRMSLSIMTFLPGIYLLLHDSLQTFMNTQMKLLGAALNSRNLGTYLYYRISCSTIIVCFDVISALSCEDRSHLIQFSSITDSASPCGECTFFDI